MSSEPITVFLVDEFAVIRRGARGLLENAGLQVIGEAGTAAKAVEGITLAGPRVAVIGLQLPDGTGIDVCRELRSLSQSVACLLMTSVDEESALFAAVMATADGYLIKQLRDLRLIEAVTQVAGGRELLDPELVVEVRRELSLCSEQPAQASHLTDEERRVLALIAKGLTNRQIAHCTQLPSVSVADLVSNLVGKMSTRYDLPSQHGDAGRLRRPVLDWPSNA